MRQCKYCGQPTEGRNRWLICKDCYKEYAKKYREVTKDHAAEYAKEYFAQNREKVQAYRRQWKVENRATFNATNRRWYAKNTKEATVRHRERKYGLQKGQYEYLLLMQEGKCAICKKPLPKRNHIDHDHATSLVRGVLCQYCNLGLGYFKDNIEFLKNAITYLQQHMENPLLLNWTAETPTDCKFETAEQTEREDSKQEMRQSGLVGIEPQEGRS